MKKKTKKTRAPRPTTEPTKTRAPQGERAAGRVKAVRASGEKKPKRVSALDTAAQVLAKAGKPMRAPELITAMAEQGLWTSPAGKTPHATLYAAMMREIRKSVDGGGRVISRFRKVDRGQFTFNKAGA
jgi:hypothetical protein